MKGRHEKEEGGGGDVMISLLVRAKSPILQACQQ